MTFEEYQQRANDTAIYPKERGLEYCILGLVGESGEVAGKYSKVIRDNKEVLSDSRKAELIKELGDVFWFCAQSCTELGVSMSEVATINLNKLQERKANNTIQGSGDNR